MKNELAVVEQRETSFYDMSLTAVRAEDGHVYASLTQMCNILGLKAQSQRERILRHTILSGGLEGVRNLRTPGGEQSAYVLRADMVPFWLSGIRTKAVREDLRPQLELLQANAAKVLFEAFQAGELTSEAGESDLLEHASAESIEAYRSAKAVFQLARRALVMEAQLSDHEERLQLLEARYGDESRYIDNKQVSMIQQAVKAIALEMGRRSGGNEFGGVYGELYRRYEIGDYRALPAVRFEEAMKFLSDWYSTITGSELPF